MNAPKGGNNSNGNGPQPRNPLNDRTLGGVGDDRFNMA